MKQFEQQTVLITGAASGIGQAIALAFAKAGANIFVADFASADDTVRLVHEAGARVEYARCDIRYEDQIAQMTTQAMQAFDGAVDILINNAGFNGKAQLVKDMALDDWEYTLRVNLTGTMLVCRSVIPHMIARRQGKIVNIASNVARRGLPYRADYVCSKWAVLGLTQTLALELVDYGIRVNAVCPGPVSGDRIEQIVHMHAEAEGKPFDEIHRAWAESAPMKRFIEPREVSDVVMFLCSEASSAMTGQALNITGGFIMT